MGRFVVRGFDPPDAEILVHLYVDRPEFEQLPATRTGVQLQADERVDLTAQVRCR